MRSKVMSTLQDEVPIPPKDQMNRNLSAATERTMLRVLGRPGALTKACSDPAGPYLKRVKFGFDVGPFKVSGLDHAVETLAQLFAEVKRNLPTVYAEVKTAGVLCVRHRRSNPARYSNHSWGASIDLYFGKRVVPQGVPKTHRGVLQLAPYFEKYGWYWGAEFSGDSVDSMHFELAEQTILTLPKYT
jgi:D-alanyl-D-alanine carboxypeptidase